MGEPRYIHIVERPWVYDRLIHTFKAVAPGWVVGAGRALLHAPRRVHARRQWQRRLNRLPKSQRSHFVALYREASQRWENRQTGATGRAVSLPLPGGGHQLWVRPGTSDVLAYAHVVLGEQYGIRLPWPVRTIVDAGANVGLASAYLLSRYLDATSIAIEPDPANAQLCRQNLAQFGTRAVVLEDALTPVPGRVSLAPELRGSWAASVARTDSGDIEGIDIPTVLVRFALRSIDLLKIDIEGSERALFESPDRHWIDRVGAFFVELESHASATAFFAAVADQRFTFARSGEITAAIRPNWPSNH